jgi:hypothetical protein
MSKSVEMALINSIASQFNARVKADGLMYRGGYHTLKLRKEAPDLKSTKTKIRAALSASGFRLQRGAPQSSAAGRCFYVIRGSYSAGRFAAIELGGSPDKPELRVTFVCF